MTNNFTTTTWPEGSDYSAAILAYCAKFRGGDQYGKMYQGFWTLDPRYFEKTELLKQNSYREAIEHCFLWCFRNTSQKPYQPLQRKEITFAVKSFINPRNKGTTGWKRSGIETQGALALYVKKNQV